ncbi:aromatic ring-hydroxylating oxygenase subunit alpha [Sphingomonas montanisoli]|uniref:Aromatic ring-hydroxylating dioxygenase subunit alpha n=1 Tax=Sphingomonas montanisoli TaxID=2606412 RepID=A0A5D9C2F2_9SPHN|nr:aromatic ring-hydroxylating dioxygenase subunit alpha [Sphingomonas montanisoli]TZG26038.1 aromatic ring-hydroxylating dioxygenase subunit alpha [Sphingomonas montanisoli]
MQREARIRIARELLDMIDNHVIQTADEPAVELDIGRFTDPVRFEKEKQELFLNRTQLLAFSADVPEAGSYYATEVAGRPILIVRGKDEKVRAFLNACRHRGVQLAEGCGKARAFVCPYHAWTFGLDGALVGVPGRVAFDDLLEHRDLIELQCVETIGFILVNPNPAAPPIDADEFFGPMKDHLAGYHYENLHLVSEFKTVARINWKHAVDGGVEGYHVPYLHPETVGPMTLPQFLHLDWGLHHTLVTTGPDIVKLKDIPEEEWPEHPYFSCSNSVFPNSVVIAGEAVGIFQRSDPADEPGKCNYIFRVYGWGKNPTPAQEAKDKYIADMLFKVAMDEDMKVQSNSQIMMENGAVPSIILGRREQNVLRMHKNYDRLIGHDPALALAELYGQAAE